MITFEHQCGLFSIAAVAAVWAVASDGAEPNTTLTRQAAQQDRVRKETVWLSRRATTMLRVLRYYDTGGTGRRHVLGDVANTLDDVHRRQMRQVVDHFELAASDGTKAATEVEMALAKHREILTTLQKLRARYDAVQTRKQEKPEQERIASELAQAASDLRQALEHTEQAAQQARQAASAAEQQQPDNASQAIGQSQQSTQAAQSALQQAAENAPQQVQENLGKAAQNLNEAEKQLAQSNPAEAGKSQQRAASQIRSALQSLEAMAAEAAQAAEAAGSPNPSQNPPQQPGAQGNQPGVGQDIQPGIGQGKSQAESVRAVDPHLNDAASRQNDKKGKESYVDLPPRQRELIRQMQRAQTPPEYIPMIRQYNANVASGKPATALPPNE